MVETLLKEVQYAKTSLMAREELYRCYGRSQMAYELGKITWDEFMKLNHEIVYDGINNKKYF